MNQCNSSKKLAKVLICSLYLGSIQFYIRCGAQDLTLKGKFSNYLIPIDTKEKSEIVTKCFSGLNFITCLPIFPSSDELYQYNLPYYNNLADNGGTPYCLQCCGYNPTNIDIWNLTCSTNDITATTSNVYGYELRLARNSYTDDLGYVTCPLRRSACTYDGNGMLTSCDRTNDGTYLIGYTLHLSIDLYDENFKYWRGVSKCEIEPMEAFTPLKSGQVFHEVIIMNHSPQIQALEMSKSLVLLSLLSFLTYFFLYICRRKNCVVCQNKLVLSFERCMMCKFVGAEPPDPRLLNILEAKGENLQGIPPERFYGSTAFVALVRRSYRYSLGLLFQIILFFFPDSNLKYGGVVREVAVLPASSESSPETETEEMKEDKNSRNFKIKSKYSIEKPKKKKNLKNSKDEKPNPHILVGITEDVIASAVGHFEIDHNRLNKNKKNKSSSESKEYKNDDNADILIIREP